MNKQDVMWDSGCEEHKKHMVDNALERIAKGEDVHEMLSELYDNAWRDGKNTGSIEAGKEFNRLYLR